jgi:hypothetical protein
MTDKAKLYEKMEQAAWLNRRQEWEFGWFDVPIDLSLENAIGPLNKVGEEAFELVNVAIIEVESDGVREKIQRFYFKRAIG